MTETAKGKTVTTYTLDFAYDAQGAPYSITVTLSRIAQTYYYITNLQGDVLYLIDASKNVVVSYDYDPYGKIIGTNDYSLQTLDRQPTEPEDTTKTIADLNPLRYRGYYYDTDDLGFYYLQSRYYDADTCRFISVDSTVYIGITGTFLSQNLFAYCENNPVKHLDREGNFLGTLIGAVVGAAVGALDAAIQGENILAGAASGAVSGAITGAAADIIAVTGGTAGVVIAASAFASGAGSLAGSVVEAGIKKEKVDWGRAFLDAGWSAATGAFFGYIGGPVKSQLDKVAKKGLGKVIYNTFCRDFTKKAVAGAGEEILSTATAKLTRFTVETFYKIVKETK